MATKHTLHYDGKTWPIPESEAQVVRDAISIACKTGTSGFVDVDVDTETGEDGPSAVVDHLTLLISPYIPVVVQTTVDVDI